jgi:hypothetical protein
MVALLEHQVDGCLAESKWTDQACSETVHRSLALRLNSSLWLNSNDKDLRPSIYMYCAGHKEVIFPTAVVPIQQYFL